MTIAAGKIPAAHFIHSKKSTMAKITKISYTHKPTDNSVYQFFIYSEGFDPKKETLIFKISYNFYYPVYNQDTNRHYLEVSKNDFDFEQGKTFSDRMVRLYCYEFQKDATNYVATGSIKVYKSTVSVSYWGFSNLVSASVTADKPWIKGLTITSVLGPYQDNKPVTKIDLSKPVKYAALTNKSGLHPGQLLAAQWSYSINGGEKARFSTKVEWSRDSESNKIIMQFQPVKEWENKEIKVYAYFSSPSEQVASKAPGFIKSTASNNPKTVKGTASSPQLIWGNKVSIDFERKVLQICKDLWGDERKFEMANGLMAVMKVETWGSFKAHHLEGEINSRNVSTLTIEHFHKNDDPKSSRAVGLIQFTQDALEGMKEFPKSTPQTKGTLERYNALNKLKLQYAKMGELNQLDKVKKYLSASANRITTPSEIYLQVFAPIGIGKPGDYVLYKKDGAGYENNSSMDTNPKDPSNKGITRDELLARYWKSYKEGMNNKKGENAKPETNTTDNKEENNEPKDANLYKIDLNKLTCTRINIIDKKDFKFEIYKDDKLLKTYIAIANKHGFVKFPETGPNWGRYGTRDAGKTDGDNWATSGMYAAVLAFFYSLKDAGINETLYYNDISAFDGVTNLGHETHRTGKDIDIRYPGCTNKSGSQYWTVSRDHYGSQKKMDEKMGIIYSLAVKLDMTNNYHHKTFPNTRNKAFSVHQDHFHLGLK